MAAHPENKTKNRSKKIPKLFFIFSPFSEELQKQPLYGY